MQKLYKNENSTSVLSVEEGPLLPEKKRKAAENEEQKNTWGPPRVIEVGIHIQTYMYICINFEKLKILKNVDTMRPFWNKVLS